MKREQPMRLNMTGAGHKPDHLINMLGERLAFERAGVRLYDVLIQKCEASPGDSGSRIISSSTLRRFRDEENEHMSMLKQALASLGAESAAPTPDAEMVSAASSGIDRELAGPHTTIGQCLDALQLAELADNVAWGSLHELCLHMGLDDLADECHHAIIQEDRHTETIDAWARTLALQQRGGDHAS
jgi:hypothetical protein